MPAKRPKPECRTSVVGYEQLCFQQKAFSEHVSPHAIPRLHHNTVTKVSFLYERACGKGDRCG